MRLTQLIPYKSYPNFLLDDTTVSPPKIVSPAAVPNLRRSGSSRREHSNGLNQFALVARSYEKPFEPY